MRSKDRGMMDYSGLSIQSKSSQKQRISNTDITYFCTDHNEEEILNPIMKIQTSKDLCHLKEKRGHFGQFSKRMRD